MDDDEHPTKSTKTALDVSFPALASSTDSSEIEKEPVPQNDLTEVVSTQPSANTPQQYEATVSIQGMTCASCSGAITRALEAEPWVNKVEVSLLTNSATIIIDDESKKDDIVEAIEDAGFDASLGQFKSLAPPSVPFKPPAGGKVQATYIVTGMTCSSCVSSITKVLEQPTWIAKVDVNLLSNSATVIMDNRDRAEEVIELIEDTGFDAKLDKVIELDVAAVPQQQRDFMIRIDGMYCEHCPKKIVGVVQDLSDVSMVKPPSLKDPVVSISYIPHAPELTARTILRAIADRDPAFKPAIYKPPSLEERSRKMYRREQSHIFRRLLLSIISAVPTFIIGIVLMSLVSSDNNNRQYLMERLKGVQRGDWAMFALAAPVYFFAADVFHRKMLKEVRSLWRPGSPVPLLRRFYRFGSMNMLISLGTSIAFWASFAQLMTDVRYAKQIKSSSEQTQTYFDSVVFLTMFLLVGRLIEAHSKARTGDAVTALGRMRPSTALLVEDKQTHEVSADLIDTGDTVRILPGTSPPCDGKIIAGRSMFDESSLTGESRLISKTENDDIYSGTVNKDSAINMRVTSPAGQSMLDDVVAAIREGQTKRAPIERTADVLTGYFVPVITFLAVLIWIIWLSLGASGSLPQSYLDTSEGGWAFWALEFATAVFVVACPCGLGLAAPTALFVGSGIAAQHGILVKGGGEAFQEASEIDVVAFDKTGTLTMGGEPKITDAVLRGEDVAATKALIARLEQDSNHPIAKALVDYCLSEKAAHVSAKATEEISGKGLKGTFEISEPSSRTIELIVGNEALMLDYSVSLTAADIQRLESWKHAGNSVALAAMREPTSPSFAIIALFAASDPIRPEAHHVITSLRSRNIDVWMITGDNQITAEAVATQVGLPPCNVIAGVLPIQKSDKIKYLQQSQSSAPKRAWQFWRSDGTSKPRRAKVAMLGDGINDAPALATADVGIALASGTDVAVQTAPFVILSPSSQSTINLNTVLTLFNLSHKVFQRVRFNFGWALVYNLILVPIAAGVLYPVQRPDGSHVRLDPAWAALAMACSSVSVVLSSLALRWRKIPGIGFKTDESWRAAHDTAAGKNLDTSEKAGVDMERNKMGEKDLEKGAELQQPEQAARIDRWGSQARRGKFLHA